MRPLRDWFSRPGKRVEKVSRSVGATIPATVVGVYGTVHTDVGDFETAGPERIEIDCEMISFYLPIIERFDGTIRTFTLHFGTTTVEVPMSRGQRIRKHDNAIVVMPVAMAQMTPGGPLPEWAKR
jgi:hypothetical protein